MRTRNKDHVVCRLNPEHVDAVTFGANRKMRLVVHVGSGRFLGFAGTIKDAAELLGCAETEVARCLVYRGYDQARGGWYARARTSS